MGEGKFTREQIVEAARGAGQKAGGVLSRSEFTRLTGISEHHVYNLFPEGGWTEVGRLAGLERHPQHNEAVSDADLLAEFHRVASALGKIPTWPVFSSRADVSAETLRKRFGGIRGTLARYAAWLEGQDPASPLLAIARAEARLDAPPGAPMQPIVPGAATELSHQWPRAGDATEFGAPINFRGLQHAPISEQGVVYLFGMVSRELGFLVEAVRTAYPDCEAKRCVDRRRDRWQRVRIEFEYRSSNFAEHGHDPAGCDLVVCWEHDWPACPVEVLELRQVIRDLD